MLILTCETKDKKSEFILLPSTIYEAINKAKKMNNLGCEPLQLYIGEHDEYKDKNWLMQEINNR